MIDAKERSETKISDYFSQDDFMRIKDAVSNAEINTSGEIRVVIRSYYDKDLEGSLHEQTKRDFLTYGLDKTRDKTGVIILLVLEARKFMVWGDEGINAKLPQGYWDVLSVGISSRFKEGDFVRGICEAVSEVGRRLSEFFPKKPDDVNELPNDVITEEDSK